MKSFLSDLITGVNQRIGDARKLTTTYEVFNVVHYGANKKQIQEHVEAPAMWSQNAVNVVTTRWLRGRIGYADRENSTRKMHERVAKAIVNAGIAAYGDIRPHVWEAVLIHLQEHQYFAYNTPVYLNAGWTQDPRCSACFLVYVEDDYLSLARHPYLESLVFQHGGGVGVALDNISHEGRELGRGGYASGPLSFNEGWDRISGAIKSGGSHRRAARDVTMSVRHPDCYRNAAYLATLPGAPLPIDFIREKQIAEDAKRILASHGWDATINGIVQYLVPGQNANRAVSIPDAFMEMLHSDDNPEWNVTCPRTGDVVWSYPVQEIWDALCTATHACGDPTIKFETTINQWNTTPNGTIGGKEYKDMKITRSNPCFGGESRILTSKGWQRFDELAASGDADVTILDRYGRWVEARVRETGEVDTIEVRLNTGHSLRLTPNHQVFVHDDDGTEPYAIMARDLNAGDPVAIVSFEGIQFPNDESAGQVFAFDNGYDVPPYKDDEIPSRIWVSPLRDQHRWLRYALTYRAVTSDIAPMVLLKSESRAYLADMQLLLSAHGINMTIEKIDMSDDDGVRYTFALACYDAKSLEKLVKKALLCNAKQKRDIENWDFEKTIPASKVRVESVRTSFPSTVYDFVSPSSETGYVNGVLVHNCNEVLHTVPPVSGAMACCNLAMMKVSKYYDDKKNLFRAHDLAQHVSTVFATQDMVTDYSEYPTPEATEWAKAIRIIGIGMSDLGGLLMRMGLPYDSEAGRYTAGAVAALIFASAARTSAMLAKEYGPCPAFEANRAAVLAVWFKHHYAMVGAFGEVGSLATAHDRQVSKSSEYILSNPSSNPFSIANSLYSQAADMMAEANGIAEEYGVRNMQLTAFAPNGTTGFGTDCDSTGIEPLYAIEATKMLSGGGIINITPECVDIVLHRILASANVPEGTTIESLRQELTTLGTVFGNRLKIFETAMGTNNGGAISPESHIKMLAHLQPFVSGSCSKTVNLPESATVEDISDIYKIAWKMGIKNIAVYRDKSKVAQVLYAKENSDADGDETNGPVGNIRDEQPQAIAIKPSTTGPHREKLAEERVSICKKLLLGGHKLYLQVGLYEDGRPGEIFLQGLEGSFLSGIMDSFAVSVSLLLQYGVPFDEIHNQFSKREFPPNGWTTDMEGYVRSFPAYVVEYIRKNVESGYFERVAKAAANAKSPTDDVVMVVDESSAVVFEAVKSVQSAVFEAVEAVVDKAETKSYNQIVDVCHHCQGMMIKTGRCYTCTRCGESTGGCG